MTKWAVIIVVLLAITISGCSSNGKSNDNITDVGEGTTVNNSQENIGNNTEGLFFQKKQIPNKGDF